MKNKNIIGTKTIVIDPYIIFILINVWLHKLLKKFNMDVTVKMARFQIKQNVLNLKSTLVATGSIGLIVDICFMSVPVLAIFY